MNPRAQSSAKTLWLRAIIGLIAASLTTAKLFAQGTVFLNNYDSKMGIYEFDLSTPAPAGTFFEVFGGPNPQTMFPLVSSSGAGPVFSLLDAGVNALGPGSGSYFNEGYTYVPGVQPYGTGFFQICVWMGGTNYDTSIVRTASLVWSQVVGKNGVPPVSLEIPQPILFIPEPSSFTLVALTGLAWLAVRRTRRGFSGR